MFTTTFRDGCLNVLRNTAHAAVSQPYAGLITAITDFEAGTVTEASYSGYDRHACSFDAPAAGLGGRFIQNTGVVTFDAKADAGTVNIIAVGIYSLVTGGDLLAIIMAGGLLPFAALVDGLGVTGNTLAASNHGLAADQRVYVDRDPAYADLPTGTGFAENATLWVVNPANDTIQLSTSQGGGAIDFTAEGGCIIRPYTPLTLNQNDQATFAAAALKMYLN